tara:strand:- start:116 stop:637 length:522 start_codon:yes stop_codon:yes gene_type:complete
MSDDTTQKKFYVYWIVSGRCNYIGATVDPVKRLRQHCGCQTGGAKYTRGKLWTYKCVISGFRIWNEALQCEWACKYYSRRCRGIESRKVAIENVLKRERWTSNSPLSSEVPLIVEYDPIQYGFPPDKLPTPKQKKRKVAPKQQSNIKKAQTDQTSKTVEKKRKWKKNVLGVRY